MARNSLACADNDRSPTSSRNNAPPSACSNFPLRPGTPVAARSSDAEELGLEQRLDQCSAVEGDKRSAPSWADAVHLPGHKFLARTTLAFDQTVKSVSATRSFDRGRRASRSWSR
jgi:hypothetical protein